MALPWRSTDARLVERVRCGDTVAFEHLYRRYGAPILAFCRHLTGQLEDAEDALQHTFLAAYRQMLDSTEELELRPWLYTVARNRCLTQLRARKASAGEMSPDHADRVADGTAAEVERRDELRQLVGDVQRLPETQRAALVLSQLEAMPYAEIGQVLGVEPEKVKALVFQARTSLASTREARDAPCIDVRRQLATARGASLRRVTLRRHVRHCSGCSDYEAVIRRQRRDLAVLLPALPSASLSGAVLGAIGRDGPGGSAGAAALASSGGSAGGGLAGSLATLGGHGAAKLAIVAAVAGGGGVGAVAVDVPARIGATPPSDTAVNVPSPLPVRGEPAPVSVPTGSGTGPGSRPRMRRGGDPRDRDAPGGHVEAPGGAGLERGASSRLGDESTAPGDAQPTEGPHGEDHVPPGLVEHGGIPPGQAKKQGAIPPGQAKKQGAIPPGQAKKQGAPAEKGNGKAKGNGNAEPAAPPAPTDNGPLHANPGNGQNNGNGQNHGNGNGKAKAKDG